MKELDPNKIAVELVKQFAKPIFDGVGKLTKEAHDKLKVTLNTCFSKYVARSYDRYSKTKTLLYRDAPVNIKEFYVRTDLEIGFGQKIKESNFIKELQKNKRLVISGTAGSGKSTFCKSIFLDLIENPMGVFPIFVELRHLNTDSETSLFDFILKSLTDIESTFTKSQLDFSLGLGKVLLIFDGFDELNNELREKYEKEIVNIASKYQNILLLLSSRPDGRFHSWEEFYVYRVLPLDKDKSKALISKLDYDRQVKRKFLDALDKSLYKKHKSFASNPLLLTMMLLTYEQIAEIPNKIHLFYEQAFLTLFNKHDSLKSLYKRKSFSNLPLDDFKNLLSAFSIVSYADRKYYFSESDIKKYLGNAIRVSGVEIDQSNFLNDLLDTVCIMQRDGNGYTFTHRSFQEYFTSIFVVNYSSDNKFKIIDKVAFINDRDDVIPMVFDINQDLLEQEWVIPRMEAMIDELSVVPDTKQGKAKLLSLMYKGLTTHDNEGDFGIAFRLYSREGDHIRFIHILFKIYGEEISHYHKIQRDIDESDEVKEAEKQLIEIILKGDGEKQDFLSLEDPSSIPSEVISLLYTSNCYGHINTSLNYSKEKLSYLREKYTNKKNELSELLFS
ncbi:NACHT domain-containing protein [Pseudoalteromonas rubra]|uniref:NACHT domain-containing protein n=1 Tax=Pseudoalteromonas rubra TaxID=43658 RepID=UPI002DBC5B13|nr:NACHT domain-containing protein [Pseudoalteromonas rubra]MEC4091391.1 NACHT domain-containing protein [Pseudoalteromonas rubra]